MSRDPLDLEIETRISELGKHDCIDNLETTSIWHIFRCARCLKRFMMYDNGSYEAI